MFKEEEEKKYHSIREKRLNKSSEKSFSNSSLLTGHLTQIRTTSSMSAAVSHVPFITERV